MLSPLGVWDKARLVAEILAAYVRVRYLVRTTPIATTVRRLRTTRRPPPQLSTETQQRLGVRLARAVVRTLGFLPTDTRCLMSSLVLARLLAARGIPCSVVLSALTEPAFAAHAWVEYEGVPLLPPRGQEHHRLVEL